MRDSKVLVGLLGAALCASVPARAADGAAKPAAKETPVSNDGIPPGDGPLYATLETSMGTIKVRLFEKDAPKTVANFVGLATGARTWTHPKSNKKMEHRPLYDGTSFHRVIPNFMIQAGDPFSHPTDGDLGRAGTGDAGYKFEDEFQSGRQFDRPGLLAMANSGPNTNGSQWFITEVPTPHLSGRHTIFGEVVSGFEIVPKIARVPTGARNKPLEPVILKRVVITRESK